MIELKKTPGGAWREESLNARTEEDSYAKANQVEWGKVRLGVIFNENTGGGNGRKIE